MIYTAEINHFLILKNPIGVLEREGQIQLFFSKTRDVKWFAISSFHLIFQIAIIQIDFLSSINHTNHLIYLCMVIYITYCVLSILQTIRLFRQQIVRGRETTEGIDTVFENIYNFLGLCHLFLPSSFSPPRRIGSETSKKGIGSEKTIAFDALNGTKNIKSNLFLKILLFLCQLKHP